MNVIRTANLVACKSGAVLLVKRGSDQEEGGLWSLPGGTKEQDENIEEALKREIEEELGAALKDVKHQYDHTIEKLGRKVVASYFLGTIGPITKLNTNELSEYYWFPFQDIPTPLAYEQDSILAKIIGN